MPTVSVPEAVPGEGKLGHWVQRQRHMHSRSRLAVVRCALCEVFDYTLTEPQRIAESRSSAHRQARLLSSPAGLVDGHDVTQVTPGHRR